MKTIRKPQKIGIWKQVRSKTNPDIYYTYTEWTDHEIDGIVFIPAVKEMNPNRTQQVKYLRKDSIEYVK